MSEPSSGLVSVSLDFITGLPVSQGNTVILVLVDQFSKACELVALPGLPSARQTTELLMQHVVRVHGMPSDLVSDRGSQANQDLAQILRCLVADSPSSWARHLPWAEYAHKTLWHSSLGMSPFECQFGYPPPMFPEQECTVGVPTAEQLVRQFRQDWRRAWTALVAASGAHTRRQIIGDRGLPPTIGGSGVRLSAKDLPLHAASQQLAPRYVGLFKVDRLVNPVTYWRSGPQSLYDLPMCV
ncbi:hypothetical protein NFI96_034119 [Prochilodus magdalenae]|nr:hypothetical protein NFI96_034119 [Prochilodus magdalenae]